MLSGDGLMFGIINIVGNFGTVFVDQSYWQSAIAARPSSAAKGYLLGGICWFAIPFSLATSLGLASTALMLPIDAGEAGSGLVPPAVADHLLGQAGSALILIMLFMAIVSTGSAESIAVSSLIAYDIYREYFNPEAIGKQILMVSRIVIVAFGIFMGLFSILLKVIGLNLGWVYLFMGICIGSAVIPLWNMMTWDKASGKGAVIAAWSGLCLAVAGWLIGAKIQSDEISVATLGTNEVMLSGNLIAILSSGPRSRATRFPWPPSGPTRSCSPATSSPSSPRGSSTTSTPSSSTPRTSTAPPSTPTSTSLSRTSRALAPSSRTRTSPAGPSAGSPAAATSSPSSSSSFGPSSRSPHGCSPKSTSPSGCSSPKPQATGLPSPSPSSRSSRARPRLAASSAACSTS